MQQEPKGEPGATGEHTTHHARPDIVLNSQLLRALHSQAQRAQLQTTLPRRVQENQDLKAIVASTGKLASSRGYGTTTPKQASKQTKEEEHSRYRAKEPRAQGGSFPLLCEHTVSKAQRYDSAFTHLGSKQESPPGLQGPAPCPSFLGNTHP